MSFRNYTKKPITIQAKEWDGTKECLTLLMQAGVPVKEGISESGNIVVNTLEGDMVATRGDMIIKGVKGEFYPCKPDIFALSYDESN